MFFFISPGLYLHANPEGRKWGGLKWRCNYNSLIMNVTKVSFYKEKIFSARWFQTWGTLLLGSMVIATGYTFL